MKSLRHAILFWMALLLFIVGAVSAGVTYEYVRDETQTSFDAEIKQIAQFLQNETAASAPLKEALAAPDPDNPFLIQIWNVSGELIRTSDKTVSAAVPKMTGFSTQNLGHADWRSYSIVGTQQLIRVSLPLDERNEQASTAALQIAIPIAVVIPLSWLVLSLLIDRILAGLNKASARVRNRNVSDQSQISLTDVPREIVPFVESINSHVAQVQAQADRQKRFLADAAHELRTPLTALSIQLGNLKTVLRTPDQRQRLAAAEGGSRRANQLVTRLLQLARHDSHVQAPDGRYENLSNLLNEVVARFEPQFRAGAITLRKAVALERNVALPATDLIQVCEILLDNAIRHSPVNTVIDVSAKSDGRHFDVVIADQGSGIDPAKLPLVFDRFYRADPHKSPGTGLGLAIAKVICDNHGWSINLKNREEGTGIAATISGKVGAPKVSPKFDPLLKAGTRRDR